MLTILAWCAVAMLVSLGFVLAVGTVIREGQREAPVDSYRRLSLLPKTPPTCPTCGREADIVLKSWASKEPLGWSCSDHGLILELQRKEQP